MCERPTEIDVFIYNNDNILVDSVNDIELSNITNNIIIVSNILTLTEDNRYTSIISFSNIAGDYDINSIATFSEYYTNNNDYYWLLSSFLSDTFGVQSVNITDSSNGRVCIECVFSLYSTDTGCTVELISSSIIQYTDTFTRPLSDNTATGCITNITTGLYTIRVYDQDSNIVAATILGFVSSEVIVIIVTSTQSCTPLPSIGNHYQLVVI